MNSKSLSPKFPLEQEQDRDRLFSGVWMRWSALTIPERVVCVNIILLPVWWFVGLYRFMPALMLLGIAFYEIQQYGSLRLRRPTWSVLGLLAFSSYRLFGGVFHDLATGGTLSPSASGRFILFWYGIALLLWYIQSNNIKVRLEAAAWACSVLVLQMLGFWVVGQFILGGGHYNYPPTLFARLTGSGSGGYEPGEGLGNFLIPYRPQDISFANLVRWSFFFVIPENLALASGFIILLSLDIKNRYWSMLLLAASVLLLLLSGTRSGWLAVPIVIGFRYLFTFSRAWGYALPLALAAMLSFATLSVPPVTNAILDSYTSKSEDVGKVRADSTQVRGKIYEETLRGIPNKLYFGHWIAGPSVLPGFELGRVGTHSFILGTLLYRHGLAGTFLFLSFWLSLFAWLYKTREGRPLSGYGLLIFYSLVSPVMEFGEVIAWMIILLGVVIRSPVNKDNIKADGRGESSRSSRAKYYYRSHL